MQTLRCHWNWGQTNWTYHSCSPHYFNRIQIVTAFKCSLYLKKLCQNCQLIFEIITHKTLTRTNIQTRSWISVLRNHNIVTNVDQICRWSAIFFPLVTHTVFTVYWYTVNWWVMTCCHLLSARSFHPCSSGFYSQLPRTGMIILSNDVITLQASMFESIKKRSFQMTQGGH